MVKLIVQYFNDFGNIFKFDKKKPKDDDFYLIFYLYQLSDKIKTKIQKIITNKTKGKIQFKIIYTTPDRDRKRIPNEGTFNHTIPRKQKEARNYALEKIVSQIGKVTRSYWMMRENRRT